LPDTSDCVFYCLKNYFSSQKLVVHYFFFFVLDNFVICAFGNPVKSAISAAFTPLDSIFLAISISRSFFPRSSPSSIPSFLPSTLPISIPSSLLFFIPFSLAAFTASLFIFAQYQIRRRSLES